MSPFLSFLDQLFDNGQVQLTGPEELSPTDLDDAIEWIGPFENDYRSELAGEAPPFSPPAFRWAAAMFYRAAQCVVYRDIPESEVKKALSEPFVGGRDAAAHYSVDLMFRFLPDLRNFARSSSTDDPLCDQIDQWCFQWPLSSVGARLASSDSQEEPLVFDLSGMESDPCLMQLYVDRILERKDRSRLNHRAVMALIQKAVGNFPELAGNMAPLLSKTTAMN